jgi:hypothetical protein
LVTTTSTTTSSSTTTLPAEGFSGYSTTSAGAAAGDFAAAVIRAGEGGVVELGGAGIAVPPGALTEDTEITIIRLYETEETGEGLKNATAGGGGYRFLPAGLRFQEAAEVRLPYEERAPAGAVEELLSYYYDRDGGRWEALERVGIDEERGQVVSLTTHFTDMINGTLSLPEGPEPLSFNINSIKGLEAGDPSAGVLGLQGLEGNYQGGAGFRFALSVPAGRAGMAPEVGISYSSDGGNGVVGKGFSLEAGGEVRYDTRRGLPEYGKGEREKGRFTLEGVLLEFGWGEGGVYRYRAMKEEGFEVIEHYTGAEDYWKVTDKGGTVRIYGRRDAGGGYGSSWGGAERGKKYRWLLESVRDSYGNGIRYEYGNESGEVYIEDIWYTEREGEGSGAYRVHFEYGDGRADVVVDGRGKYIAETRRRLEWVGMYHGEELVRRYRLEYMGEEEAAAFFGVTRLKKFGESELGEGIEEYLWAYEFEYEGFKRDGEGRPVLYGEQERWVIGGPLQEQKGESGGGGGTVSAGAGVGPAYNVDARVTWSGQFGSSSGYTETERTLADIDGDGRPDSVWVSGGAVKAYLNKGSGFEEEAVEWVFEGGGGPGYIGREEQWSNSYGMSFFTGAATPVISPGVDMGETIQESWTNEELGFTDINGDGLADIAEKGKEWYWRNAGDRFIRTGYRVRDGAGIPLDVERELTDEEIKGYDKVYYQQTVLRAWRAPLEGQVEVEQAVRPVGGAPLTEDGIGVYTYTGDGGGAIAKYELAGERRSDGGVVVREVKGGEAFYFVGDAGSDIRGNGEASDDIEWNIKIRYRAVSYFEELNRHIRRARSEGEREAIPGVVDRGRFEELAELGGGLEYEENWWTPAEPPHFVVEGERHPSPLEALFRYYRYDAGRGRYYINTGLREEYNAADEEWAEKYRHYYQGENRDGWEGFHAVMAGRSWRHLEAQIINILALMDDVGKRRLMEVRLPGREEGVLPRYDREEGKWYYEELGGARGIEEERSGGIFLEGNLFLIDRYEGEALILDLGTGEVRHGGVVVGTGVFEEDGGAALVRIQAPFYRQEYRFEGLKRWRDTLEGEEGERLREALEEAAWLAMEAWERPEAERYEALAGHPGGGMVSGAYEAFGPGYRLKEGLSDETREELRRHIGFYVRDTFFGCYDPPEEDDGEEQTEEESLWRIKAGNGGFALTVLEEVSVRYRLYGWGLAGQKVRYYEDALVPVEDDRIRFVGIEGDRFIWKEVDIGEGYSWDSGEDFSIEDLTGEAAYYEEERPGYDLVVDGEGQPTGEFAETGVETVRRTVEVIDLLPGGRRGWYYGIWFRGQEESGRHQAERFSEAKLLRERELRAAPAVGELPVWTRAHPARWIEEGEEGIGEWSIEVEAESGRRIAGEAVLAGPVTVIKRPGAGVGKYAAWIAGDVIHTGRAGGGMRIRGCRGYGAGGRLPGRFRCFR